MDDDDVDEIGCSNPNCEDCNPPEPRRLHWTDPIRFGLDLVGRVTMAISDQCGQTARALRDHAEISTEIREEGDYARRALAELDLIPTRKDNR